MQPSRHHDLNSLEHGHRERDAPQQLPADGNGPSGQRGDTCWLCLLKSGERARALSRRSQASSCFNLRFLSVSALA
jgi:hypothetical protein